MTPRTRWADVTLHSDGVDISEDLSGDLISLTYTDNATDKADDLSVTLEDIKGRWSGGWFPSKGATLTPAIIVHEWNGPGTSALPCGTFQIDQIECSGKPSQVTIKAVSTFPKTHMRYERACETWESITLQKLLEDVAGKCGLGLRFDARDRLFDVRHQMETPNLTYALALCHDYGMGAKVVDGMLFVYDEAEYEGKGGGATIRRDDQRIERYQFTSKTDDTYKRARLQYHDPIKDETWTGAAEDDVEGTERVLELCDYAESDGDAAALAKAKLHDKNKREMTASVTVMGSFAFHATDCATVEGFGAFDGSWFIERVTHEIGRGTGYTTKIDLRKKGKSGGGSKKASEPRALVYEGTDVYGRGD